MRGSIYDHVGGKRVRSAAAGGEEDDEEEEEEMKLGRYRPNYPQYKIIICLLFSTASFARAYQRRREVYQILLNNLQLKMSATIQQKAIYTETQAGKLQITRLGFFFVFFSPPSSLERAAPALRFVSGKHEFINRMLNSLAGEKLRCTSRPPTGENLSIALWGAAPSEGPSHLLPQRRSGYVFDKV